MMHLDLEDMIVPYLLGELSSSEAARLEAAIEEDPALRRSFVEIRETLAEVALSAPQVAPPPSAFAEIRERIRDGSSQAPRKTVPFIVRLGGIAAACAAAALTGFWWGQESSVPGAPEIVLRNGASDVPQTVTLAKTDSARMVDELRQRILFLERQNAQAGQKELVLREALHELLKRSPHSLRSPEFLADLEDALELPPGALDSTVVALLRAVARMESGPGIAQVTVMELTRPGDEEGPGLAPIASSIISDAFHSLVDDSDPDLALASSEPGPDYPTNSFWSPVLPGGRTSHESLATEATGLPDSPFSTGATGTEMVPDGEAQSSVIGMDATSITQSAQNVVQTFDGLLDLNPVGLVVFLGEGEGTMSMRGLPPVGPEEGYQLWGIDDVTGTTFSIGMLPALPQGRGQVSFDVSGTENIPTRMLLTKEPATGSSRPGGTVILETAGSSTSQGGTK